MRNTSLARIFVQKPFCSNCVATIKQRIMQAQQLKHLVLFPMDSLVVFSFNSANQISEVLNTLVALGYPPEGDFISSTSRVKPICECCEKEN